MLRGHPRACAVFLMVAVNLIVTTAAQEYNLVDLATIGSLDVSCQPGEYSRDGPSPSSPCVQCPAGQFSVGTGGFSRPGLTAGYGKLTEGLPNGERAQVASGMSLPCHWDDCVASCACTFPCGWGCSTSANNPAVRDYMNTTQRVEVDGIRVCGNARQAGLGFSGEPGNAIDGDTDGKMHMLRASIHPSDHSCIMIQMTNGEPAWWQIDLGGVAVVSQVGVYYRTDGVGFANTAIGAQVVVSATTNFDADDAVICGLTQDLTNVPDNVQCSNAVGRWISLITRAEFTNSWFGSEWFTFCELEVWGSTGCAPCSRGTFSSSEGSTACTACNAGEFAGLGATECSVCSPGTTADAGECVLCAAGSYDHDSDSTTACVQCPSGKFLESAGTFGTEGAVCQVCEIGTFSLPGEMVCTACEPGKIDNDHNPSTLCERCPAGRFAAEEGLVDCTLCPTAGVFAEIGSSDCEICAIGKHDADSDAATACVDCPDGQIASLVGMTECTACGAGRTAQHGLSCECEDNTVSEQLGGIFTHCVINIDGVLPRSPYCAIQAPACQSCSAGSEGWDSHTANNPKGIEWLVAYVAQSYTNTWLPDTSPTRSTKTCAELCDYAGGHWCNTAIGPPGMDGARVCGESDHGFGPLIDPANSQGEREQVCYGGTTTAAPYQGDDSVLWGYPDGVTDFWSFNQEVCSRIGARMCTVAEMITDETKGSGCQHNADWIWTSTPCATGHVVAAGAVFKGRFTCPEECGSQPECICTPRCMPDDTVYVATRCCADQDITLPVATVDPPTACVECPAGLYSPGGSVPCAPCPAGSYITHGTASSCSVCPNGLVTPVGARSVAECSSEARYLGLYADQESFTHSRDLAAGTVLFHMGSNASVAMCGILCREYRYMGLQYTDMCFW
jgi:hypothetical protein